MRFETPWALLGIFVIIIVFYIYCRMTGRGALLFSSTSHGAQLTPSLRQRLRALPLFIRLLCLLLLVIALARPQEGREKVRDISRGIAIEMLIDRSGSMAAEMDYDGERLSRLEVVKRLFEEFVSGNKKNLEGRPNDLIGMVSFARYADTVSPLTLAHGALAEFLKSVHLVKRKEEDGTAIGDAIALGAARLKTAEETLARQRQGDEKDFEIKSKIIILLTDGQNNAGKRSPIEAAKLAKKWGIKVYTIGVGGREGLFRQHGLLGNFLMSMGEGVDEKTLKSVAESTGGIFRLAEDAEALRAVYKEIDELERSEVESVRFLDYRELFQPIAITALLLLSLEIILSCTIFRKIP